MAKIQQRSRKQVLFIPPVLRAAARAVNDVDPTQFPELYAAPGQRPPPVHELQRVTTEINDDEALSSYDFRLFQAAYAACRQHLRCVSAEVMASGTPISEVLTLTTCVDARCTEAGIALSNVFPLLQEVHNYIVMVSDQVRKDDSAPSRKIVFDRLIVFLGGLLHRALFVADVILKHIEDQALEQAQAKRRAHSSRTQLYNEPSPRSVHSPTLSARSSPCHDAIAESMHLPKVTVVCRDERPPSASLMDPGNTSKMLSSMVSLPGRVHGTLPATLPVDVLNEISSVNADLGVHMAHIRWYVSVTDGEDEATFDVAAHIGDLSMQKMWSSCIGSSRPACPSEEFAEHALLMFPEWLWGPLMDVLNFKKCGVVSLFSVQRVLKVWGPLLLLDRNLADDVRGGMLSLSQPFSFYMETLARRPEAKAGDYVVALTETPGDVRVAVLRASRHAQQQHTAPDPSRAHQRRSSAAAGTVAMGRPRNGSWNPAMDGLSTPQKHSSISHASLAVPPEDPPLVAVGYRLSQDTGAWLVKGLTREEFENITAACRSFPEVFGTPQGDVLCTADVTGNGSSVGPISSEGQEESTAPSVLLSEDMSGYSTLNRACFRNNDRYVNTLLGRGAATTVNSAVADSSVSSQFTWTPLLCAVNNPNSDPSEVVRLLLDAGADVHYRDEAECTALYYAIANGYGTTTRMLLNHCPTLISSPTTHPLLVALGAHHFLPSENDIRRLADTIPSASVIEALCSVLDDSAVTPLAIDILQDKLNGVDRLPSDGSDALDNTSTTRDRRSLSELAGLFPAGSRALELHTPEEDAMLSRLVRYHSRLCRDFYPQVAEALRVLQARCYVLSWKSWLKQLDDRDAASKGVGESDSEEEEHGSLNMYSMQLPTL